MGEINLEEDFIMYQDKDLTCRDCGDQFSFTASEQEFFAEKGFTNDPSRCSQCRSARKQRSTNNNNNNFRQGGRPQRELHPATCANCGTSTQVPFKPTNDRPVYCRDCYSKNR
jgi:CxxC-x17-CxxC domain-containing protein